MTNLTPHPARTHRYITTGSGVKVMCPGMRKSMVRLRDVAHSLAMQCRYLGHVKKFYSVAEHSVLTSRLAEYFGEPSKVVKACLLHDAHEAYIGDFPSPFKEAVPGLKLFEHSIEAAVRDAFDLPADNHDIWQSVKHYDIMMLHWEADTLFDPSPDWVEEQVVLEIPDDHSIWCLGPDAAKVAFRKRLRELDIRCPLG